MSSNLRATAFTQAALALLSIPVAAAPGGQTAKLVANDAAANDQLGFAVAINGATAIAGCAMDDDSGVDSGSAYLFDAVTGLQTFKLLPGDGAADDRFGYSVAIAGGLALVGAVRDDDDGAESGSAYLFDTSTGLQTAKLLPIVGAAGDEFGVSVGLDGPTAIVGAKGADESGPDSGAAYLFDATSGLQTFKLLPNDGAAIDFFGFSVAVSGNTAIVGAPRDDDNGTDSGSAYLFDVTTGQQLFKLLPAGGAEFSGFGWSVAIDGPLALVGAVHENSGFGAAYLFDTATGLQLARFTANDGGVQDSFGYSVGLRGTTAIVGAPFDNTSKPDAGSAYLFDTVTRQQFRQLFAGDPSSFDSFGMSVAIHGTTAMVGAVYSDGPPADSGAAYLFDTTVATAVPYCFGTGDGTPCPCGNAGIQGRGCANSVFAQGAKLWVEGSACVGTNDLVLRTSSSRPNQTGLFFQGNDALNGGMGFTFGDGLRCAGGQVMRLQIATANASGSSSSTVPIAVNTGVSAGDVRRYQWWYRDPGASPCGSGFNLSNGLSVTWGP